MQEFEEKFLQNDKELRKIKSEHARMKANFQMVFERGRDFNHDVRGLSTYRFNEEESSRLKEGAKYYEGEDHKLRSGRDEI